MSNDDNSINAAEVQGEAVDEALTDEVMKARVNGVERI
jgi:hypothetical protein